MKCTYNIQLLHPCQYQALSYGIPICIFLAKHITSCGKFITKHLKMVHGNSFIKVPNNLLQHNGLFKKQGA